MTARADPLGQASALAFWTSVLLLAALLTGLSAWCGVLVLGWAVEAFGAAPVAGFALGFVTARVSR